MLVSYNNLQDQRRYISNCVSQEGTKMKRIFGLATLLFLISVSVHAEKICVDDTIDEVAGDGAILTMLSGSIWKVDDVDRVDSGLWLGTEDVLICSQAIRIKGGGTSVTYTILNKDESGEEVSAARIGHK
jgi:hypothetical protein